MQVGGIRRVPDEPALDAKDLNWLIDEWLKALETDVRTETLGGYRVAVRRFQRWWDQHGENYGWRLTRQALKRFEYHLRGEGGTEAILNERSGKPLAWNTRHDSLRRLSEALHWAQNHHYFTDSAIAYSEWVPAAHGGKPKRQAATLDHLQSLHDAIAQADWPTRAAAAIALTYDAGLRRMECVNLKIEEISFFSDHSGVLIAWGKRTQANPDGMRQVAFDAAVGDLLIAYLDEIKFDKGPFFRSRHNLCEPVGQMTIYREVKQVIQLAGLENVLQAVHDGRRNYTTHVKSQHPGDPLHADRVRRNLGHATYSQTADYDLTSAADMVGLLKSPLQQLLDSKSQPRRG